MKFLVCIPSIFFLLNVNAQTSSKDIAPIKIIYTPGHPLNSFIPKQALGAAFDGHEKGDIDKMLLPGNIKAMRSVGLNPLSYRLRTELAGEVWHWNPAGKWSEKEKQQGYWISDSTSAMPIHLSYGYRLPRRGNTIDHANDDDYSRLDDGDKKTFWKSNPYLDECFTKEPNSMHPQWAIVDLGKLTEVNAIRIVWGNPYALSYTVDYALDIGSDYFEPFRDDLWHSFSSGKIINVNGENKPVLVSDKPVKVRFIRIKMEEGSHTAEKNSADIRDKLGFAICEMEAGLIDKNGKFYDKVKHAADHKKQSVCYVSSTDLWHRSSDIDYKIEQAGIDYFFNCGLTTEQPTLMPIGLLYDTPENMVSLLKYIHTKNYNAQEFEMGEEPEGQLISPVDYACLYNQWAKQLKPIIPNIKLGGPGFATLAFTEEDITSFSEGKWTKIFLNYLEQHNALSGFNFFTFEWYPFDDICAATAPQLAAAPGMLTIALRDIQKNVLPPVIPVYITEYGYSAFSGKPEVDIEGALMYADIAAKFLTLGGNKCFLYGYEPAYLETEGCDWGNNILFGLDDNGKIKFHSAAYYGMKMLTQNWTTPSDTILDIFPTTCSMANSKNEELISSYAIHRSDNKWSILLINKDPVKEHRATINIFNTTNNTGTSLHFPAGIIQYSRLQYKWLNNGEKGHPSLDIPPIKKIIMRPQDILLPPYSISIISEQE